MHPVAEAKTRQQKRKRKLTEQEIENGVLERGEQRLFVKLFISCNPHELRWKERQTQALK